jgi:membrane-bound lytic murein transglycosylase D
LRLLVALVVLVLQACATAPQPELAPDIQAAPVPPVHLPPAADATRLPPFQGEKREIKDPLHKVKTVDRASAPRDVWERIRRGFAIPDLKSPMVRKKTAEYARNGSSLQGMLDRSRPYLFHIVEEIEKRGLPMELALLPMVESAFNPMAYSRARASGLWQFIPGTGRRYELQQTWWYDGRRDVIDSTGAALDHLAALYKIHKNWHLALASYNWGEGAVSRAIAKNRAAGKKTDYSSLRMPRETSQYVPKLQALKNIIADPKRYGVVLDPIPNEPYFAVVMETPDIDVRLAAQLAEMPLEEFMALNPGFSRPITRAEEVDRLVLPWDKVSVFHQNLARHTDRNLVSWRVYRPQRGDTVGTIARRFGLSIAELKRVNGIAARSWKLPQALVVPMGAETAAAQPASASTGNTAAPAPKVHVVRHGDTLSTIAEKYRVKLQDLKRWNKVGPVLRVGQKIYLGAPLT